MSGFRKIITKPGEVIDFETVFEENPTLRTGVPSKMGTVERVEYTTDVYGDGKTYSKYCYVYLPYGYDAADKSKKYNVLYFQHGNTCEPAMFAIGGNKYMFDMLFNSGELDPCIIVFVTYYMDPMRDAEELYRAIGANFARFEPWQVYVLTSCEYFEKLYGRRADKVRKLYNGMIPCYFYQYFKRNDR